MDWEEALKINRENIIIIVVGLVGVGILSYGVWSAVVPEPSTVEIVSENQGESGATNQVIVDVAGAVEKPGVYSLPSSARIGDALVVAGGLSAEADRTWVSQTINLAERIEDGGKIFIPNSEKTGVGGGETGDKININKASQSELEALSGIGEVRASAIIANRPYGSAKELVEKAEIPESVYDKIKDRLTVY